jgi:hypothetical protein
MNIDRFDCAIAFLVSVCGNALDAYDKHFLDAVRKEELISSVSVYTRGYPPQVWAIAAVCFAVSQDKGDVLLVCQDEGSCRAFLGEVNDWLEQFSNSNDFAFERRNHDKRAYFSIRCRGASSDTIIRAVWPGPGDLRGIGVHSKLVVIALDAKSQESVMSVLLPLLRDGAHAVVARDTQTFLLNK